MQDIKWILENPEAVEKGAKRKGGEVDIDKIVSLSAKRNETLQKVEALRARQNEVSKQIPNTDDKKALLEEMGKVKAEIKSLDPALTKLEAEIDELAMQVPNPPLDSTPDGGEEDSVVVSTHGEKPEFDFEIQDHIQLGKKHDIIDIERGTRTSGARFYYLKNEAAMMEFALIQFVSQKLIAKGFSPIIPPVLVKEEAMFATGFFPADKNEIYQVDDLYLAGTSEVPLTMLHYNEIIDVTEPKRYFAFSPCFRREAGSYGKDTAGIIRVHQFNKMEMFVFCHPEQSEAEHELIRETEEEIMQELGFHYQVVNIAAGDLGAPAVKKYDIEVWIPTQDKFRELTSASNCTDFQSRRAKIRYTEDGKKHYVHTLNGTAFADTRTLVALIENNQNSDGTITIPEVLRPFMGGREQIG